MPLAELLHSTMIVLVDSLASFYLSTKIWKCLSKLVKTTSTIKAITSRFRTNSDPKQILCEIL